MQCDLLWAAPPVGTTLAVTGCCCSASAAVPTNQMQLSRVLLLEGYCHLKSPASSLSGCRRDQLHLHRHHCRCVILHHVHLCHTLSNRFDQAEYGVANHKRPSSSGFCPEQMGSTWQLASKAQCNCMMQRVVGTSRRCIHTRCMSLPPPCCRGHRMLDREWTTALCRVLTCWHHAAPPGCHLQHILVV